MDIIYNYALSCTRYYYLVWYEKYVKATGGLPPPRWNGPPIPLYNVTHDDIVRANRVTAGI